MFFVSVPTIFGIFVIEKLWASYRDVFDAMMAALLPLSEDDRGLILSANAARIYRLSP